MRSGQDDARLPKVFEGLVLVCEGLSGIGLAVQGRLDRRESEEGGDELMLNIMKRDVVKPLIGKSFFGFPLPLVFWHRIDLLQELNLFLPRVKPGNVPLHSASAEIAPLSGIKSNLVRLLGILTYEDIAVGDLVRECGGVQLVLSMTEVDESNPCTSCSHCFYWFGNAELSSDLREHALFVTRNLMLHNPANQALVAQMDPVGLVSETGELLPLPERMRRDQQRHEHANGSWQPDARDTLLLDDRDTVLIDVQMLVI